MDALFGNRPISFKALTDFSKLNSQTKKHLKNVYACLAVSMLSAAVGAAVHLFTSILKGGGLLTLIGSVGFILALAFTSNEPKNQMKRLGFLTGMAFCTGLSLGPLLESVIQIEPTIVATAFSATCLIFVCFSLASLWAEDRKYLYMGGTLMSSLLVLSLSSILFMFTRSQLLFQIHLYGGLLIFCGFILYDTQLIIEKQKKGDNDFIWHSVDLFLDFINIFRRILIILGNKESSKRKKKD